ncbi:Pentatricopeptide repeat-containing protein, partial [Cucurbita argyrosperma subsp. sororia]
MGLPPRLLDFHSHKFGCAHLGQFSSLLREISYKGAHNRLLVGPFVFSPPRRSEVRVLIRLCVCSEAISALAVRSAGKWRYAVYRSNNVAKRSLEEAQYKKLLEKWLLKEEHSATLKKLRNRKLYNPALKKLWPKRGMNRTVSEQAIHIDSVAKLYEHGLLWFLLLV